MEPKKLVWLAGLTSGVGSVVTTEYLRRATALSQIEGNFVVSFLLICVAILISIILSAAVSHNVPA